MATTAICGTAGTVSLGGEITKWTVNLNIDTPEATSMASVGNKEFLACLKDADFTFDTLVSCGDVGAETSLSFVNTKCTISFNAIVNSVQTTTDVNGVVTWTYSGVSTGTISGF